MISDENMRRALWASAVFNLGGALLFALPAPLGELGGFPGPVPRAQNALLVEFIVLFAGAYAWLALQPSIDRPLVAVAAIGKAGAFTVVFILWLLGDVPIRGVAAFGGDLLLAGIFAAWLLGSASPAR